MAPRPLKVFSHYNPLFLRQLVHETGCQDDARTAITIDRTDHIITNTRVGSVLLPFLGGPRRLCAAKGGVSKISPDNPKFGWSLCLTVLNNSNNSRRCEQLNNVKS